MVIALTSAAPCQSATPDVDHVMSNKEARSLVLSATEATVPPGFSPTEFTVRIKVLDGEVTDVSNSHSLPDLLFAAAADAARHWHFPDHRWKDKPHRFEAEITFHGPITGKVIAKDGMPVEGVVVSGILSGPKEQDRMTTDTSGSFRIEHPGTVLHFDPPVTFQPQALVIPPDTSALNINLYPASTTLPLTACGKLQPGFERMGWGNYGLQFDVPLRDVKLIRGDVDVDYVVDIVKAKKSNDRIEFWFGPYAMTQMPNDNQFVESETFAIRNVTKPGGFVPGPDDGVIGHDVWGRLPNGKMWRQTVFGAEGPRYQDVSPENAAHFDQIINSACWIPYPEH